MTGEFDPAAPDVEADLQPGAVPRTTFGLVVEALARRRDRGLPPFTVMSCDNVPGNGHVARRSFAAFAALRDPELGEWVRTAVAFPNSMVDRITPATTDLHRAEVARRFGVEDGWPVLCEPWTQWVLEDDFTCGRPPLEQVGVQLVVDVEPYELMKLRLLTGSHQALGYLGSLAGTVFMHDAAQDPLFRAFLRGYMDDEAAPALPPRARHRPGRLPGRAPRAVLQPLRPGHPRPALRGELRPDPVIRDALGAGGELVRAVTVVAAWARYAEGVDDAGDPIEVVDPRREELMARARRQREDPLALVADRGLFADLVDDERFTSVYRAALASLHEHGARATVQAAVDGTLTRRAA
ncbi:mannitol dehydrogenase family protein [Modestobacter altitudinis]|uniref:mannitol dehydrogenase family protein n=1 Tax=Modestobacter altitudinis TaxID=2213158 RepID=UPI001C550487|nr:mannitol dehydrogenase family protein [Modestobacter altitudinis]